MLRLLAQRFGDAIDATIEARIHAASSEDIEQWVERVLTAPSIGEVLGS